MGVVVLLVLGLLIVTTAHVVVRRILYTQYNDRLAQAVNYVQHNTDADDLQACLASGESSAKRDALQTFVNTMIDDFELSYIYLVVPGADLLPGAAADARADLMINVVSATNAAERAAGEEDMPLLEGSDAYSVKELQRYRDCWDATNIVYFEETSDYGAYYTACKPLRASDGRTVALLCIDVSSAELHRELTLVTCLTGVLLALVVCLIGIVLLYILRKKAIEPIVAIADSAKTFAKASEGMTDVGALVYDRPDIDTLELSALADALVKMADNMREYVTNAIDANRRATQAEEENIRLQEKAAASAKINQLTESVRSLFGNMPAMAFSKEVATGKYLACNQRYAEYVGKASPKEVVGLTDADMFNEEDTKHFAEMDAIAMSMDAPYVFVEDVISPDGKPMQFQTTKLKFVDGHGRVCILGMCSDTTELRQIREESQAARRAYEEARTAGLTYANIAKALATDYSYLYYVDLETKEFLEYRSDTSTDDMVLERRGEDFFRQSRQDAENRIYSADLEAFLNAFTEQNILKTIDEHGTFTLTYRLLVTENPTYVSMKITRMVDDHTHLVVGVNNVDAQMRIQEEIERAREEHLTFARISALSGNYICIYTVDPETDRYLEYNVTEDYEKLHLPKEGDDFFAVARRNGQEVIYSEDLGRYMEAFTKENVMEEIAKNGIFAFEYRLLLNGVPTYVRLKAAVIEEVDGPQMVVGVSNIDAQIKREQDYAARLKTEHNKAYVDVMTGLQNKHAYVDYEAKLNHDIDAGKPTEFAVVVLDINDLKHLNDTEGHRKGDALIMAAAKSITEVFAHSSIYRVGGDEFVVIAEGEDYRNIDALLDEIAERNRRNLVSRDVVLACGMARYEDDLKVSAVFERADVAMYRNKKQLKGHED